jgi:hypothetical protein
MFLRLPITLILLGLSTQSVAQDTTALADRITASLAKLGERPDFNVEDLIAKTYRDPKQVQAYENLSKEKLFPIENVNRDPGEFGYLVTRRSDGEIEDIFTSNAPILLNQETGELTVAGYEAPDGYEVVTVSGDDWDEARSRYVEGIVHEGEQTRSGRSVSSVAASAGAATMTWAAKLCPTYVYPSKVTLYLNAGFDFVVLNTDTGTEIEIIMEDACSGLSRLLENELSKETKVD